MKIKSLCLFSDNLNKQKVFFLQTLGFDLIYEDDHQFSVRVGDTSLEFKSSEKSFKYHYCFLIPSNKLEEAISWLEGRLELIKDKDGVVIQKFESWNAASVYFLDGNENLLEFIVRYNLDIQEDRVFGVNQILNVNEIGMPSNNIGELNSIIEMKTGSKFWKGDMQRFGTNGDEYGLFLLPNTKEKHVWFPTLLETQVSDFTAEVEWENDYYIIKYFNMKLDIKLKS